MKSPIMDLNNKLFESKDTNDENPCLNFQKYSTIGIYFTVIDHHDKNMTMLHYVSIEQAIKCIDCEHLKNCGYIFPMIWTVPIDQIPNYFIITTH